MSELLKCFDCSAIEGIFGNLRSQSTQNIKRGFCRVVGLVKTSLMLTFEVVAANIRLCASGLNARA